MGRCEPERPVVVMVVDPTRRRGPGRFLDRLSILLVWAAAALGLRPIAGRARATWYPADGPASPRSLLLVRSDPGAAARRSRAAARRHRAGRGLGVACRARRLRAPGDRGRSWRADRHSAVVAARVTARAAWLCREAVRWHRLDPLLPAIQSTGSSLGDALSAIGHAVMAIRLRLGTTATPWHRSAHHRRPPADPCCCPAAETRSVAVPHAQITPTPCTRTPVLLRLRPHRQRRFDPTCSPRASGHPHPERRSTTGDGPQVGQQLVRGHGQVSAQPVSRLAAGHEGAPNLPFNSGPVARHGVEESGPWPLMMLRR